MGGYTIAFVPCKSIARIFHVEGGHQPIASHLGNDTCRRDAQAQRITSDQGRVSHGEPAYGKAVNKCVTGLLRQSSQCACHGEMCGAEDVEAVNFFGTGFAGGPKDVPSSRQCVIKDRPCLCGELLGIGQAIEFEALGQDHRGGHDGAGKRAAPGFIHARHQGAAPGVQGVLVRKVAGHRAACVWWASLRAVV